MNFDLIIVGNELLNGKIEDRNTHYIAKELYKHGHTLRKVHIIGDEEKLYFEALDAAFNESDVVITTGGLGPTKDDLTKSILAKYFDKEISHSEKAMEVAKLHYKRGNKEYDTEKIKYHLFPKDFEVVLNPVGYAPGLSYTQDGKSVFATPGVPTEFQAMLSQEILPSLAQKSEKQIKHVIVKTWKIPEAKIFHDLCPTLWDELAQFGEVSSLPHMTGVDIGVKLIGDDKTNSENEKKVLQIIQNSAIRDNIWHIGPETMEEVIIKEATAKKLKIGFAESCTGGLLASKITDVSGSSAVFWGSVVSYANEVKMKSLNVAEETLKAHGAVSKETAFEMAKGAREHLDVDIAVTTTGIAGPGGGSKEKPVGTVGIGVSTLKNTESDLYYFTGTRTSLKERFARFALLKLLETIRDY